MSKLLVAGIMTGTSCDGADLSILSFEGNQASLKEKCLHTASQRFPEKLRLRLRKAQAGKINLREYGELNRDYSEWLATFAATCLRKFKVKPGNCIISVHGQTLWHEPPKSRTQRGFTIQMIDPALVSTITGCTTISFFRQPDMAHFGQGAPLVPYYHWLRAQGSSLRKKMPFAIHNVGGIANLTCITKDVANLFAFDTGPANALIDIATEKLTHGKQSYDKNGSIAFSALDKIDWAKIEKLGRDHYFKMKPPKSTGRELFNADYLKRFKSSGATLVAEATAFTAHTMALAYKDFVVKKAPGLKTVYLAGGGAANPILEQLFAMELEILVGKKISVDLLPADYATSQFLESMAFARFGLLGICGKPVSLPQVTGAREAGPGVGIFPGKNHAQITKLASKFNI